MKNPYLFFYDQHFKVPFSVSGDAGSLGEVADVQQHQQTRTEEKSTGSAGRPELVWQQQ